MLQTEFAFTLPRGYVDAHGTLHRKGTMRLATALDEIEPLQDPRVRSNEAYFSVVLLSRVITRLGEIRPVTTAVIEGLFSADLAYLQTLYLRINDIENEIVATACPHCGTRFTLDLKGSSQ